MHVVALIAALSAASAIGPIPVTPNSHPFDSVYHVQRRIDIQRFGYIEQEYFLTGLASVYQYGGGGASVFIRTRAAPFTTRILIERPATPSRFSGNVIVELMNASLGYDLPLIWQYAHDEYLRSGDAYVGVTIKPQAVATLKRFNASRYAPLSMKNPIPLNPACPQLSPDASPATENGLAWDIVSELGVLLKARGLRSNPLFGLPVQKVFAAGYSQSASYLVTYINALARQGYASMPDGHPVFDGYFIAAGDGQMPINQCSPALSITDSRNVVSRAGVPVMRVQSQSDFGFWLGSRVSGIPLGNSFHRRADSDSPGDQFRLYEIAGDSHVSAEQVDFGPDARDLSQAGQTPLLKDNCNEQPPSDFPAHAFFDAMWFNLERWVRYGVRPPSASRIVTLDAGTMQERAAVDQFDNARGGVRSSLLDVPAATYVPTSTGRSMYCVLQGHVVPFSHAQLSRLYGSHDVYVARVRQSLTELVAGRWLLPFDATDMFLRAERAPVP